MPAARRPRPAALWRLGGAVLLLLAVLVLVRSADVGEHLPAHVGEDHALGPGASNVLGDGRIRVDEEVRIAE